MLRFPKLHEKIVDVVTQLLRRRLPPTNSMVTWKHFLPLALNNFACINVEKLILISFQYFLIIEGFLGDICNKEVAQVLLNVHYNWS